MIRKRNALLDALPARERSQLSDISKLVEIGEHDILYRIGKPLRHVFFPYSGVISLSSAANEECLVEVATVGNEGFLGLPAVVGASSMPMQAFAHTRVEALRVPAEGLRRVTHAGKRLADLLARYTHALFHQVAQSVACTAQHSIEERCARSLLMIHDRAGSNEFPMTQEALSQTLGVRRAPVNEVAKRLKQDGAIDYMHGRVRVSNRKKLEAWACGCYELIVREYRRLVGTTKLSRFR